MKTFKNFPQDGLKCPICNTKEDGEWFLMPIEGTDNEGIIEKQPTHVDCIVLDKLKFNQDLRIIYFRV